MEAVRRKVLGEGKENVKEEDENFDDSGSTDGFFELTLSNQHIGDLNPVYRETNAPMKKKITEKRKSLGKEKWGWVDKVKTEVLRLKAMARNCHFENVKEYDACLFFPFMTIYSTLISSNFPPLMQSKSRRCGNQPKDGSSWILGWSTLALLKLSLTLEAQHFDRNGA